MNRAVGAATYMGGTCLGAFVACLGVMFAALAMPVAAQVTASSATDPTGGIDFRLSGLMGVEHAATQDLSYTQLQRLGSTFVPSARGDELALPSAQDLDARPALRGAEAWECLTQALYFEARGETVEGQFAVAEVILNRVDDPRYPATVCDVINEGTGRRYACQFTYTCDGRAETVDDIVLWNRMGHIAQMMLDGHPRRLTDGATHYHANWVNPRWAQTFPQTAEIGVHLFYRRPL
ncbi:MAG: cell wall hydrolase [Pseudomonadota bacterium]